MQESAFYTKSLKRLENYDDFIRISREKINRYLNMVLWFCTLTGPAIALGVKAGIFPAVNYDICIFITCYVAVVSFLNLLIIKKWPTSVLSGMFALLAMDVLLVLMAYARVAIYLTWFLIPLLSLLFANGRIFGTAILVNYCFMVFSTWQMSSFNAAQRLDYDSATAYFLNYVGGFTIETFIMTSAAIVLSKVVIRYFSNLIDNYKKLDRHREQLIADEEIIKEDMVMLNSMAGIYEYVNFLDFSEMTETPIHDTELEKKHINIYEQTQSSLNLRLNDELDENQLPDFTDFTDITTLQNRLTGKKFIAKEFISKSTGWFRAQYINIEPDVNEIPNSVIYTVQDIDKDKRREEQLIKNAITDELTGLFNRRCFDNDVEEYENRPMEDDLVIISIDVNGLKTTNDTLGHSAGDDLIKGAAFCSQLAFGTYGKVYRTGGDEFMSVIHTDYCDFIQDTLYMMTYEWVGSEVDSLSVSVGYAAHRDHPDKSFSELVKIADAMMYEEKEKYYRQTGKRRRK